MNLSLATHRKRTLLVGATVIVEMDTLRADKKLIGRAEEAIPLEVGAGQDSLIFDAQGEKYIDFTSGWCVGNIGWNVDEVRSRIREFAGPEYVQPIFLYKPWVELAHLLVMMAGNRSLKVYRATGGTEAVEFALQAARKYTGRKKFLKIEHGYHGHSIAINSMEEIPSPLDAQAGLQAATMLASHEFAAFIIAPVTLSGGVTIPSQEFFDIVTDACNQTNTVFIADEVAAGFGRTGKRFSYEHFHLIPDIICLGKGVTSGYGVLGATLIREEIAKGFESYSTFGWQPIATNAALANVQYYLDREVDLLENAKKLNAYITGRLKAMAFKEPTEMKEIGCAISIRLHSAEYASQIVYACRDNGVLIEDSGPTLQFFPALSMELQTAAEGLAIIERCI